MPFETAQITGGKSPDIQISIYPAVAQITWTWEDEEGIVQDYEHFSIPFILTVDKVLGKIRNKTLYYGNGGSFIPATIEFTHNIGRCGRSLQVILQINIVMTFYLKSHLFISSATSQPILRRSHHRSRHGDAPAPPCKYRTKSKNMLQNKN